MKFQMNLQLAKLTLETVELILGVCPSPTILFQRTSFQLAPIKHENIQTNGNEEHGTSYIKCLMMV